MKVIIGSDHAGFSVKEQLRASLADKGHEVLDAGTASSDSCDYPDFAFKVVDGIRDGNAERGILVCGSGIGMSMAANRFKGIRAALCHDVEGARLSRAHNNANILCLGARMAGLERLEKILWAWLETPFEGGRHEDRVAKFDGLGTEESAGRQGS